MKAENNIVDVEKVLATIDRTFKELREGVDLEKMDDQAIGNFEKGLDLLEVEAWKCKINLELKSLVEADSSITLRGALINILSKLPDTISSDGISELIRHTKMRWKELRREVVAV